MLRNERSSQDLPPVIAAFGGRPCLKAAGQGNARGAAPAACEDGPRTPRAGTAGTGPPLSGSGDSILSRLRGSRPTPVESLNLNPPLSPPRAAPGPLSLKSTRPSRGRKHCWRNEQPAALSADPRLPQTLCMGACHHTPVCRSGCIPSRDHPREPPTPLRPGGVPRLPLRGAMPVVCVARALRTRVRSPHALLLVQWRLVAIWVSRAQGSARAPSSRGTPAMSRGPTSAMSGWPGERGVARGRGTGQCGLVPPLALLKRTGDAPPYDWPEELCVSICT